MSHDDPTDHSGMLVWDAEEIVHALHPESDRKSLIGKKIVRVPGLGTLWDAQRALQIVRMICRRRMRVSGIPIDPTDRLAGLDVKADRIEPYMRAIWLALHPDLDRFPG